MQHRGLGLCQRLCRQRLAQLAHLAYAGRGLGDGGGGLGQTGAGVAVVQLDQQLPALDSLAATRSTRPEPCSATLIRCGETTRPLATTFCTSWACVAM